MVVCFSIKTLMDIEINDTKNLITKYFTPLTTSGEKNSQIKNKKKNEQTQTYICKYIV